MNRMFVCLALTTAMLTACGQSDVQVQSSTTPPADVTAPVAAAPATPSGDAVLIDGYAPAFPHKVRSMRDDGRSHFVVIEYLNINRDAAIATLAESLSEDGFNVRGPKPRDAAVQYVYVHADGRRLDAIFSDPSTQKLMNADARGVVMFSWTDAAAN